MHRFSPPPPACRTVCQTSCFAFVDSGPQEFDDFVSDLPYVKRQWLRFQFRLRVVVEHNMFNNGFLLAIIVNTILLALEYDGVCGCVCAPCVSIVCLMQVWVWVPLCLWVWVHQTTFFLGAPLVSAAIMAPALTTALPTVRIQHQAQQQSASG